MYNHEPKGYKCPLCFLVKGITEDDFPYSKQPDIIFKDDLVTAFIASHWWPNNKGHVIVIPNDHIENIYDLPNELGAAIHKLSRRVAKALKTTYHSDGVSTRQHNEPDGGQDIWHYHLHIFPRYKNDMLYESHNQKQLSQPEDRLEYATKLRNFLDTESA